MKRKNGISKSQKMQERQKSQIKYKENTLRIEKNKEKLKNKIVPKLRTNSFGSYNYKISIKFVVLFLIFINPILMLQKTDNNLRKLQTDINSTIIMKIGKGINKILSDDFNIQNYPQKLYINGELMNVTFNDTISNSFIENINSSNAYINSDLLNFKFISTINNSFTENNTNGTYNWTYNEFIFENETNEVILEWNTNLKTCEYMFSYLNNILEIDFSNFDSSEVTNMDYMFYECVDLQNINFTNFNTSSTKSMSYMFGHLNVTSLDLSHFDTSKVENMSNMFYICEEIISLNLANFDTSSVTSMSSMIISLKKLEYLDISNFDTSKVTDMSFMFYNNVKLKRINVGHFNTSFVIKMDSMFGNLKEIESLDLSNFDTKNVQNMSYMFGGCSKLKNLKINSFDTSSVEYMHSMFSNLAEIKTLDLSNFSTNKVKNMSSMFENCGKLSSLNIKSFDTSSVTYMNSMFRNLPNLVSLDLSFFNTEKVKDMSYMFCSLKVLTFLNISNFDTSQVTTMKDMFSNLEQIKSLDISNFNTRDVHDMSYMFSDCKSLDYIDLGDINTLNTKRMEYMFQGLSNIKSINVSIFNTRNVENMKYMFSNNINLENIDLKNFDTSSVITMENMFNNCQKLKTINLSNFNTRTVKNMKMMFNGCQNLDKLIINNFDTSSVTSMENMFSNCLKLPSIDLSNFNTTNVKNLHGIFSQCENLENLNLTNFDTKSVTNMNSMFYDCRKLSSLNLSNFNVLNTINMENMFKNCILLSSLDISNFNTKKVESMKHMFYNCYNLKYINFKNIKADSLISMEEMFYECSNLKYINIFNLKFINNNISINNILFNVAENLEYCVNDESKILSLFTQLNNLKSIRDCSNLCYEENRILDKEKNLCLKEKDLSSENENSIEYCSMEDFFNSKCIKTKNVENKIEEDVMIQIKKEIMSGNFDSFLFDILNDKKKDYTINENNTVYQLTSSYNQNNKIYLNLSNIYLGECENILKKNYNISENDSLLILKVEYHLEELLIPIIEYIVFHPYTKKELNLSYCDNTDIKFSIPANINEETPFIYDPNSAFYNDICFTYTTKDKTDMIINDRVNQFNEEKLALCEKNCTQKDYDSNNKKVLCQCKIKNEIRLSGNISFDKDEMVNKIKDVKKTINLHVMKCYKKLFSKEGFIYNIGSYILLSIILIYILLTIFFYLKGNTIFKNEIRKIIGYMKYKFAKNKEKDDKKKEKAKNNDKHIHKRNKSKTTKEVANNDKTKIKENNEILDESSNPQKKNARKRNQRTISNFSVLKTSENHPTNQSYSKSKIKMLNNKNDKDMILKINNEEEKKKVNSDKYIKYKNLNYNDYEINNMVYKDALKFDKRNYFQFYFSLLKLNHLLIFTFFSTNDYNPLILKICLFIFYFSLFFVVNALFFNNSTIHTIFIESGRFNFVYQLPQMIYSSLIIYIINNLMKFLSLTETNVLSLKKASDYDELKEKVKKLTKIIFIKFLCFYIISFLFLILFWYYLGCFCIIFKNTQMHLIKDTLISFGISLLYPFLLNLLPGIFRIYALNSKSKKNDCIYKFSKFISFI